MKKVMCLSLAALGFAFVCGNVCAMDMPQNVLREAQEARDSKLRSFPVTVLHLRAASRVRDTLARGHLDNALVMINNSAERGFVVDWVAYNKWQAEFKELQDRLMVAQKGIVGGTMQQTSGLKEVESSEKGGAEQKAEHVKPMVQTQSRKGTDEVKLPEGREDNVAVDLNMSGTPESTSEMEGFPLKASVAKNATEVGSGDETQPVSQPGKKPTLQHVDTESESDQVGMEKTSQTKMPTAKAEDNQDSGEQQPLGTSLTDKMPEGDRVLTEKISPSETQGTVQTKSEEVGKRSKSPRKPNKKRHK